VREEGGRSHAVVSINIVIIILNLLPPPPPPLHLLLPPPSPSIPQTAVPTSYPVVVPGKHGVTTKGCTSNTGW